MSIYHSRERILIKENLTIQDQMNNFKLFIWNPMTKEFLGRTRNSWFKIILFYLCFYTILGGVFACSVFVFLQTLDETVPMYYNNASVMSRQRFGNNIVGVSPGLGFRPLVDVQSALIRVRSSASDTNHPHNYVQHVQNIDEYLAYYWGEDIFIFGPDNPCTSQRNYEFDKGKPCILIKFNQIYGWMPEAYLPEDKLPLELRPYDTLVRNNPENIFVICEGENLVDRDLIGDIVYYSRTPLYTKVPGQEKIGFLPFYYFPWIYQDDYYPPLVFAHFKNITTSVLVNVICKAFAKNIFIDTVQYSGSVHFEIMID